MDCAAYLAACGSDGDNADPIDPALTNAQRFSGSDPANLRRQLIVLSQKSSPATFVAFGAELPPALDMVTLVESIPPRPNWKEAKTRTTSRPGKSE
jgi:hypothetical protein